MFQLQCSNKWFFLVFRSLCQTALFPVADHAMCISLSPLCPPDQHGTNNASYQIPALSPQNNKEGVEQWLEGSSRRGWQTNSEPACPLSSDRQMSPLPAWPAADQGRARRLLKWRNLRAPQGVSWSFDVQHKGRVWCWMSWGGEAASAVCYKGLAWRVGKEGKILSTDGPLLYFI